MTEAAILKGMEVEAARLKASLSDRDLESPDETLANSKVVASQVDKCLKLFAEGVGLEYGKHFTGEPGDPSRRELITTILEEASGYKKITTLLAIRWRDTMRYISVYENRSVSQHERLKVKPILVARGVLPAGS